MTSRALVEFRLRKRLAKKRLFPDEIEQRAAIYMKEYDLKELHRGNYLAGKSSHEKSRENMIFEHEVWPKLRMKILDNE